MSRVDIRKAQLGDEEILAMIQTESWKSAFKDILTAQELKRCCDFSKVAVMYRNVLSQNLVSMWIETVDNIPHCIAGYSNNRNGLGSEVAELICIHSLANRHRQGFGSLMMEHVLSQMKDDGYSQVVLWVFEDNRKARGFYEKHGFILSECRNQSHGAVEVMYSRKL